MNQSKSILFVVGARPNFIKIAPLCHVLKKQRDIPFKILHTGQHYDKVMSDIFFQELDIPSPDFNLNIGSGGHGKQTGKMMAQLEELCLDPANEFSSIVVIGDVNSTLAGALVGTKLHIPVVHVESGLRSFNRQMPEEINRIATDHISDLLFAPSQLAMDNLEKEGLLERSQFSGDVMFDMMLTGLKMAAERSKVLEQLELESDNFYLATLHRPYNVDKADQLKEIIRGLSGIEEKIILSAHPRLRKNLEKFGIKAGNNIHISQPFGYLDFIMLEKSAKKIITDSGGVQKEAFFAETPCITLRPETEWVETVSVGANILVRERSERNILDAVFQDSKPAYDARPYGNGDASELIINSMRTNYYS